MRVYQQFNVICCKGCVATNGANILLTQKGEFGIVYKSFLPAGAPEARKWLVLRLLSFLCLFVCASALITCAIY